MRIDYQLELLSDWHCSAGMNAGAQADVVVLKDNHRLPYISGKTIKGLLKDAAMDMWEARGKGIAIDDIHAVFGREHKDENGKVLETDAGHTFFSNAIVPTAEREEIVGNEWQYLLYRQQASTRIERQTGLAKKGSLRSMEVCMPLCLTGFLESEKALPEYLLESCFSWTRHLGVGRNRGLGRCQFTNLKFS
ncbi:MAG: RAMP superfamily CRISPR-associated protein [Bacteroidota bacterium]